MFPKDHIDDDIAGELNSFKYYQGSEIDKLAEIAGYSGINEIAKQSIESKAGIFAFFQMLEDRTELISHYFINMETRLRELVCSPMFYDLEQLALESWEVPSSIFVPLQSTKIPAEVKGYATIESLFQIVEFCHKKLIEKKE